MLFLFGGRYNTILAVGVAALLRMTVTIGTMRMTVKLLISYLLFAASFTAFSCFLLFIILYWRRGLRENRHIKKTYEDIGDVTELFQTMRGIVEQQKQLAGEFNEDLDKKMQVVKQVMQRVHLRISSTLPLRTLFGKSGSAIEVRPIYKMSACPEAMISSM